MFELTNEQRKCFALSTVNEKMTRLELKPSPYDNFKTYVYIDGNIIVKCIISSDTHYSEYELSETITDDGEFLLPKTPKGKPVRLSSSTVLKRRRIGMSLCYNQNYIDLYSSTTQCSYYSNNYLNSDINDINGFRSWVQNWCQETTDEDLADIQSFAKQPLKHIRYKEGDVFRFKIGRRLYGYGRLILDYDKMRKQNEIFWDILMCKPLVCSVYHIATDRKDVSVEELKGLGSLPSSIIVDNRLFYGEYEIIGNIPVSEDEDYPIMYGNSLNIREKSVCFQRGKVYRKIDNGDCLYSGFINNSVSFDFHLTLDILLQCISARSNEPYWNNYYPHQVNRDLRNPKLKNELTEIKKQFNIEF